METVKIFIHLLEKQIQLFLSENDAINDDTVIELKVSGKGIIKLKNELKQLTEK